MIIAGYVFTVFNYIFYCISRFGKNKSRMLMLDLFAKLSTCAGLYCLGSLGGSYSIFVSSLVLIAANIRQRLGGRWTAVYVAFEALLVFVLVSKFAGISSVLAFALSSVSLLSIWWLSPQGMRIAGLLTSGISLLLMLSIRDWAGLLEIFVLASNILSYIRCKRKEEGIRAQVDAKDTKKITGHRPL